MRDRNDYIGKKFIPFKFKNQPNGLGYNSSMDKFNGKKHEIIGHSSVYDTFFIVDEGTKWHYPAEEVMDRIDRSMKTEDDLFNDVFKILSNII